MNSNPRAVLTMRSPAVGDSVSCEYLGVGVLQGGWDGHYDVELSGYGSVRVTRLSGPQGGSWVGVLSDKALVATNWTKERQAIFERLTALLKEFRFSDADDLYRTSCSEWLDEHIYLRLRSAEETVFGFFNIYRSGSLAQLDSYFLNSIRGDFSVEEFVELKLPRVRKTLSGLGMTLDAEQLRANARPEMRLQIKARAGSGKTRTLSARAALAIHDESLDPNQVLILAFNKAAATEVKHRVQKMLMGSAYENARTFHSLAYQLVKPRKKLLFDAGGSPSAKEQSRFAQRMMQRIVNPAFKEEMVEFFRKELEQIESIGRDLPPSDYYIFRRSLEHVTLGGQWIRETGEKVFTNGERVKSNGEKFIADFFFEHDIKYRYERAWMWKTPFLDGSTYKPDFSIIANGKDYILEHWAIDPEDPEASLPEEWRLTARQYRKQIQDKRQFWQSKSIQLLETHTGMMNAGRGSFEHQLTLILEGAGIRCCRLSNQEIIESVLNNP